MGGKLQGRARHQAGGRGFSAWRTVVTGAAPGRRGWFHCLACCCDGRGTKQAKALLASHLRGWVQGRSGVGRPVGNGRATSNVFEQGFFLWTLKPAAHTVLVPCALLLVPSNRARRGVCRPRGSATTGGGARTIWATALCRSLATAPRVRASNKSSIRVVLCWRGHARLRGTYGFVQKFGNSTRGEKATAHSIQVVACWRGHADSGWWCAEVWQQHQG